jgi:hypothetical protein
MADIANCNRSLYQKDVVTHFGITAKFPRNDGRTFHVRKATRSEVVQMVICLSGIDSTPGKVSKF